MSTETSLSQRFRPPPTVLVFPVMVLTAALHQLHHALLVLLLLQIQLLQFSLFIFCTPPLNYSPTRAQSFFFGFLVPRPRIYQQQRAGRCRKKMRAGDGGPRIARTLLSTVRRVVVRIACARCIEFALQRCPRHSLQDARVTPLHRSKAERCVLDSCTLARRPRRAPRTCWAPPCWPS
jgi:hypothetical protein